MPALSPPTAGDLLTLEELQHLRRLSGWRGAGLVLHAWAVIAGAMALCAVWPSTLTLLVGIALVGARQLGLAVLMHEAAHWRLLPRPRANDRTARWLCSFPVWGGDLSAYRRRHHLHHRHTRQPEDPDLPLCSAPPAARVTLWLALLRDLTGVTAATLVLRENPWRVGLPAAWRRWRGPLAVNAALLGALACLGYWHLYALLWLLPLATWYQLARRIRDLAEHAHVSDDDDPLRNTRTVAAGPLARIFLAPYAVNFHLEHHLMVFVPCWKLRQTHTLLERKGWGPRMEVASSYADVLRRATR